MLRGDSYYHAKWFPLQLTAAGAAAWAAYCHGVCRMGGCVVLGRTDPPAFRPPARVRFRRSRSTPRGDRGSPYDSDTHHYTPQGQTPRGAELGGSQGAEHHDQLLCDSWCPSLGRNWT